MKRLFAAVRFEAGRELNAYIGGIRLKLAHENIRWVPAENYHLTLKFFGETEEQRIPALSAALRKACEKQYPIPLSSGRCGIFGSRHQPRVIWLSVEDPRKELRKLFSNIHHELEALGIKRDRQNFVHQLTLGRISKLKSPTLFRSVMDELPEPPGQDFSARELILYESILRKPSPEYFALETFSFLQPEKDHSY